MTAGHADLSKDVRAAWAKMLGCLAALGVLALALPRPGELVSTVVDGLTGAGQGNGGAAAGGVAATDTAPGFLDTAENAVLLAAGLIVWVLLVWALAVVIIAGVGRLPGTGGRAARKALRRIAPAAAGRLVIAAVGVTAIAGAAGCAAPDGTVAAVVSVADTTDAATSADPSTPLLDIDWPDPAAGSSETPAPTTGDSPAGPTSSGIPATGSPDQSSPHADVDPAAPVSTAPLAGSPSEDPPGATQSESTPPDTAVAGTPAPDAPDTTAPTVPTVPTVPTAPTAPTVPTVPTVPTAIASAANPSPTTTDPGTLAASTPGPTAPAPGTAAAADGSVTVEPGDSLWAIAARHLPADATDSDVDTAWRAWYSANNDVIGANPDLIIPGQHLLPGHTETRP